jgi:hypothetical protein
MLISADAGERDTVNVRQAFFGVGGPSRHVPNRVPNSANLTPPSRT